MTGYGKGEYLHQNLELTVDIRTVNHRYLDFFFRVPKDLMFLEAKIMEEVKKFLARGRVEIYVGYRSSSEDYEIEINEQLAQKLGEAQKEISHLLKVTPQLDISNILETKGVVEITPVEQSQELLEEKLLEIVGDALGQVVQMREAEGVNLREDFIANLDAIEENLAQIDQVADQVKEAFKERLLENLAEVKDSFEGFDDRVLAEIAIYAERSDIREEITRMNSHILQVKDCMDADEPTGRKLDILSQEMLREANTMASKVQDNDMKKTVIEIKTLVDQIREQVQNIE